MNALLGLALLVCVSLAPLAAFDMQGHGARGLAPENTLAAFSRAPPSA
jgi:hypothetical protein